MGLFEKLGITAAPTAAIDLEGRMPLCIVPPSAIEGITTLQELTKPSGALSTALEPNGVARTKPLTYGEAASLAQTVEKFDTPALATMKALVNAPGCSEIFEGARSALTSIRALESDLRIHAGYGEKDATSFQIGLERVNKSWDSVKSSVGALAAARPDASPKP